MCGLINTDNLEDLIVNVVMDMDIEGGINGAAEEDLDELIFQVGDLEHDVEVLTNRLRVLESLVWQQNEALRDMDFTCTALRRRTLSNRLRRFVRSIRRGFSNSSQAVRSFVSLRGRISR